MSNSGKFWMFVSVFFSLSLLVNGLYWDNGVAVIGTGGGGAGNLSGTNPPYLFDDGTTISFNESKLNQTIDGRATGNGISKTGDNASGVYNFSNLFFIDGSKNYGVTANARFNASQVYSSYVESVGNNLSVLFVQNNRAGGGWGAAIRVANQNNSNAALIIYNSTPGYAPENDQNYLVVKNSGAVGIGNDAPTQKLSITGGMNVIDSSKKPYFTATYINNNPRVFVGGGAGSSPYEFEVNGTINAKNILINGSAINGTSGNNITNNYYLNAADQELNTTSNVTFEKATIFRDADEITSITITNANNGTNAMSQMIESNDIGESISLLISSSNFEFMGFPFQSYGLLTAETSSGLLIENAIGNVFFNIGDDEVDVLTLNQREAIFNTDNNLSIQDSNDNVLARFDPAGSFVEITGNVNVSGWLATDEIKTHSPLMFGKDSEVDYTRQCWWDTNGNQTLVWFKNGIMQSKQNSIECLNRQKIVDTKQTCMETDKIYNALTGKCQIKLSAPTTSIAPKINQYLYNKTK